MHKQILLFHAEAKDLGTRLHLEMMQKHRPIHFLYALALKLVCFSFSGFEESLRACSKNSSSRNVPGTGVRNVPGTGLGNVPGTGLGNVPGTGLFRN